MTEPARPPLCVSCAHLHADTWPDPPSCEAFPAGIPDGIYDELGDHRGPWPGDNGVQFLLAAGREADLAQFDTARAELDVIESAG